MTARVLGARPPYVFVVNMPMSFDKRSSNWRCKIDLEPAARYGDMVYLTPHGHPPPNKTLVLPKMSEFLQHFTAKDYLLPAGPPIYMCWAAAIAAHNTGGRLKVLVWSNKDDRANTYQVIEASLFNLPPIIHNDGSENDND